MPLRGQSVLVVEDEAFIGLDLVGAVEDAGGTALGPAETVRRALHILDAERVTAAILDVNLRDGEVTPVAVRLVEEGIPFVVHTGGGLPAGLRPSFADAPVLHKPSRSARVIGTLVSTIMAQPRITRPVCSEGEGHVLLIEDEPDTVAILSAHMRALGFGSVDQADTELEAVVAAGQRRPDLLVVDIKLREGNGLAAATAIKAAYGVPLIVVTAYPQSALGMDEHLIVRKPFTATGLQAAIKHARLLGFAA